LDSVVPTAVAFFVLELLLASAAFDDDDLCCLFFFATLLAAGPLIFGGLFPVASFLLLATGATAAVAVALVGVAGGFVA